MLHPFAVAMDKLDPSDSAQLRILRIGHLGRVRRWLRMEHDRRDASQSVPGSAALLIPTSTEPSLSQLAPSSQHIACSH
jgi:hypothetical protein